MTKKYQLQLTRTFSVHPSTSFLRTFSLDCLSRLLAWRSFLVRLFCLVRGDRSFRPGPCNDLPLPIHEMHHSIFTHCIHINECNFSYIHWVDASFFFDFLEGIFVWAYFFAFRFGHLFVGCFFGGRRRTLSLLYRERKENRY